jgi:HSP20 family molecular chaperone IbpA
MFKKTVSTALLALLPMVAVHADSNLTKNDPFGSVLEDDPFFQDFQKLQADMDKLFETFHEKSFSRMPMMHIPSDIGSGFSMRLRTDVIDKGTYYEVIADLPNMDKANIDVHAKNGVLTIKAESKKSNEEKKEGKIIRQERFVGSFYRSMNLPTDADEGKVTSEYKNGTLIVTIPKKSK